MSDQAHDANVLLAGAIRDSMTSQGMTARQLADGLGVSESTISRLINGETRDLTVDRVLEIERALGEPQRGVLFRRARLVDDELTVRQRIEADPLLDDDSRRFVLRVYDGEVKESAAGRKRSGSSSEPTARRTRRN